MGRIVVGVDGSNHGRIALRWGIEEAALRGWPLLAVHAYQTPLVGVESIGSTSPVLDPEPTARRLVDAEVQRAWREQPSRVSVSTAVAEGSAGAVLVNAALPGDVLVVGPGSHGAVVSALLGSTSRHAIAHARCAVVIAR